MAEAKKETPKEPKDASTTVATEANDPSKEEQKDSTESKDIDVEKSEPEKPKPKEYTPEEIEEIAKRVETFTNETPEYNPKHILSPEYSGTSNYEQGINVVRKETEEKLARLRKDPDSSEQQIRQAEEDLKTLDHLYENYHLGMNVFRTAHGGREKLRE